MGTERRVEGRRGEVRDGEEVERARAEEQQQDEEEAVAANPLPDSLILHVNGIQVDINEAENLKRHIHDLKTAQDEDQGD